MATLTGLSAEGLGDGPAARRRALAACSDGALVERLVAMATALRAEAHGPLAEAAALPLAEVLASPFALRAVALGVEVGATTRHVERRLRPEWPDALVGGSEVRDPAHGVWDRGVLRTGKYQGFMADEPFATYDPSHVSKWGPHELMHRAAGFLWRPGLTRWELYLGARLNELTPVVLWYGPEQVMRLDEGAFDRRAAGRRPAARLEAARWLREDEAALRERAARTVPQLREGLAHFERELAAIDEELRTGRRVRAPHPFLDASSDATAYVVGHFARLSRPEVGAVLARVPATVRCESPAAYRDRIEALFDRLLFAPLTPDLARAARRRRARVVWDLLLRAAHLGEGVQADLAPLLDDAGAALAGEAEADEDAWRARLAEVLAAEEAAVALADGSDRGVALAQLADGVEQVMPCAWGLLDALEGGPPPAGDPGSEAGTDASADPLARFAASDAPVDRAPLGARVLRWLEASEAPAPVCDMARFEAAIVAAGRDDGVERLAVPPDALPASLADGVLVRSEAFTRLDLAHEVLEVHAAFAAGEAVGLPAPGAQVLLVGGFFDGVSVLPLPDAVAEAWERLAAAARPAADVIGELDAALPAVSPEGWPADGEAWVREMIGAGALGWRPRSA
ncbi:MAG TPA: hypothetical protein RMH99_14065 [Sandaracinaceae bacterium LLY-WYZ-13_1]|nr:hypothetical protein [Sandaracinaceae bacterium LLY-WYZ-13_1]